MSDDEFQAAKLLAREFLDKNSDQFGFLIRVARFDAEMAMASFYINQLNNKQENK